MKRTFIVAVIVVLVIVGGVALLPADKVDNNSTEQTADTIEYWSYLNNIELDENELQITRDYTSYGNWTDTDSETHAFHVSYGTFRFNWTPVSVVSKNGVVWIQLKPYNPFGSLDEEMAFLKREVEHLCSGRTTDIGVSGFALKCNGYPVGQPHMVGTKTGPVIGIIFGEMDGIEGNVIHVTGTGKMFPYELVRT